MSLGVPLQMAQETVLADTQRIRDAADRNASFQEVEGLVQIAANNVRRIFGIEEIHEIVDDGTAVEELLDLKATVLELEDSDPRISLYTAGEPDAKQDYL